MADEWGDYCKDVTPLSKGKEKVETPRKYVRPGAGRRAEKLRFPDEAPPVCVVRDAPFSKRKPQAKLADMDLRNYNRFRKGQWPIDRRLDLHGFTQMEAWPVLRKTIEEAQSAGMRCLLVITGRGRTGDGSWGVLRRAVPAWLERPELSPRILAYHPAQRQDGGEGAYYVLLRRLRE